MVDINNTLFSTTDASNNANSPNGYNSSTTPANVQAIEQAFRGAVKRWWERSGSAITTTGSSNAYVYTPSNTSYPTALVKGDCYTAVANFSNTSAATIAINGLPATAIVKNSSGGLIALVGGEIITGTVFTLYYDGTSFELLNPVPVSVSGTNPSGTIIMWSTNTAPSGYLECNGGQVSQVTYSTLFGVIGTTFGAASGSNFTLPDFRGYFPRGWADNGSVDSGRVFGSTQASSLASHSHTITDPTHSHTVPLVSWNGHAGTGGADTPLYNGSSSVSTNAASTGITGTNATGGSDTYPINLSVMFCIKT